MKKLLIYSIFVILPLISCRQSQDSRTTECGGCHKGIEHASTSHKGCATCHGGNPTAIDKTSAHNGMHGGANPSSPESWEKGCGECHRHQLDRVKSTIMNTNSGMIRNIRLTWGDNDTGRWTAQGGRQYDQTGNLFEAGYVKNLDNLSGELYRKFCSRCHTGISNTESYGATHASGCAACHFKWNNAGVYEGGDRSMKGKAGHSSSHAMSALPQMQNCTSCHSRSGRIAFSYQGLYDGNNALVPTRGGEAGPILTSGARSLTSIAPDIHYKAGMECIDCHTSRDVMGDGYSYRNMYDQVETACEDCHGSPENPPRYRMVSRENEDPLRESKSYGFQARSGMEMILTSKDRPYSNVIHVDGNVILQIKRTGRMLKSKVITGTAEHTVVGHGRLACTTCHSRTVVQCYGCHTQYDKGKPSRDFIKGFDTAGSFSETEDYRTLYPYPLALNQKGEISPVTPGCQTFVTVVEKDGNISEDGTVFSFKGKRQLRFAPFYSHNTGHRATGCSECHSNPSFLGFGQHIAEKGGIKGTLLCEKSEEKPLDGFLTMKNGRVQAFSAITREGSRPLNQMEVRRALRVNQCLVCHQSARDPIFRKRINYGVLEDSIHRPLLSPVSNSRR